MEEKRDRGTRPKNWAEAVREHEAAGTEEHALGDAGNPRHPDGEAGEEMLAFMNESHRAVTEWALGFFEFQPKDRALDIGCGGGATIRRLLGHISEGTVSGLDYSPVSVRVSRETNRGAVNAGRVKVFEGSVERMPFADGAFDRIVTVESFYFWPDPAENLKEVRRVLAPGGQFLLVADIYETEALSAEARENVRRYELFNPTLGEFRQMLEAAGFSGVRIHTKEGTTWVCAEGRAEG